MLRRVSPTVGIALLTLAAMLTTLGSHAVAQDLGDIDMFGDAPAQPQPQQPADDFDLGDFGTPDQPSTEGPTAVEQMELEFQQARQLLDQGKYGEAIVAFDKLLMQNPNLGPVHLYKGIGLEALREYGLALQSYEQALQTGRQFPGVTEQTYAAKGNVLMELGQYQDAADAFNAAVSISPLTTEFLLGRSKAQIRSATQLVNLDPTSASEVLEQAIRSLDRVIESTPNAAEPFVERSRANLLMQRLDRAVEDGDVAFELEPESSDIAARRGIAFFSRAEDERRRHDADLNQATRDYQTAIDSFAIFLDLESEKTREDFEDASPDTLIPDQIYVLSAAARVALANELPEGTRAPHYRDAIDDCDRAIAFEPDSANAFYQRGMAQRMLGELDDAIDSWTTSLEISPRNPELSLRRGIAWYYLGDTRLARQDFRDAEPLFDGRASFWIGVTYAQEGDLINAVRYYTITLRFNPEFRMAYNNRGLAYMELEDFERAERDFNELLRRDSQDEVARQRRDRARQLAETHGLGSSWNLP